MRNTLWKFIDNHGTIASLDADKIKSLYLPLANEALMSSISPDLHGDIKVGQNAFLLTPVSRIDLSDSRSSRNFWIYIDRNKVWSATGVSKDHAQIKEDEFRLSAGLLWQKTTRINKKIGLKAEILSFVPATGEPVEVMQVTITNIFSRKVTFIPTAAIPMYCRGAHNIRDHRQVTSLLQRVTQDKYGVISKPTLSFDEAGHKANRNLYFVVGCDERSRPPKHIYPTQEMFCGEAGDLEAPECVLENLAPNTKVSIQGREPMGALKFAPMVLAAGQSKTYIVLMGITGEKEDIRKILRNFNTLHKVSAALEKTKKFWIAKSSQLELSTSDAHFDNWFRWVSIQPTLRKIFGCSFLPDFDYGKGGRGWRDLWQDCLGLIVSNPAEVKSLLVNNFSGVRIDGSNATIIGKKPGEFIADRNDIVRVWMDHGVWPLLTLDLYINETGDSNILNAETTYFRDQHVYRSRACDRAYNPTDGNALRTSSGKIYQGSILEHLLLQNLTQFFNVGAHNHVRLEGADWNDGLDMAWENGESVAFSTMYAHNLLRLSELLRKLPQKKISLLKEFSILLQKVNYDTIRAKQKVLDTYFEKTRSSVSGRKVLIDREELAQDLKEKAQWLMAYIRKKEWLKEGFFNGYYNNDKKRVEGRQKDILKMALTSQVFPIMSGVATKVQIASILKSAQKYLRDKEMGGYRLNTDFKAEQHNLGRAFSFVYGDKENGAFFNHMVVMFANALYKRDYVIEGWEVLSSIYAMALATDKSKIYPCLPEYFNLEGKGMYSYLTGSASWFVLTLLTEVFGVKGKDGDLCVEPKLTQAQFRGFSCISINRVFAGRTLKINFHNPRNLEWGDYEIITASLNGRNVASRIGQNLLIDRAIIARLPAHTMHTLDIVLG